jgi:hypothetical protein
MTMRRQVRPVRRSATRISTSASQQSSTCARILGSSRWNGPELKGVLQVAEAACGFEEVLVPQRDVLGGQVGVAGGQQVLPVESFLAVDLLAVDDQTPAGLLPQPPAQGGVVAQRALCLDVRRLVGSLAGAALKSVRLCAAPLGAVGRSAKAEVRGARRRAGRSGLVG